jgi:hypothetical protein
MFIFYIALPIKLKSFKMYDTDAESVMVQEVGWFKQYLKLISIE